MIGSGLRVTASASVLGDTDTAAEVDRCLGEKDRREQRLESVSIADAPAPVMGERAARLAWARHPGRRDDARVAHVLACSTPTGPPLWSAASWIAAQTIGADRVAVAEQLSALCSGGVAALGTAARWLACEPEVDSCLVTAADAIDPRVLDRWAFDGGVTLGDGAGAVVLAREGRGHSLLSVTTGADVGLESAQRGAAQIGFEAARPMDPARVRDRLREAVMDPENPLSVAAIVDRHQRLLVEVVDRALAEAGLERRDIVHWALPFVGAQALEHGYLRPLGIDVEDTSASLGLTTGHLGGADALVAVDRLEAGGRMAAGDPVALVGVGSGLSISCALLGW